MGEMMHTLHADCDKAGAAEADSYDARRVINLPAASVAHVALGNALAACGSLFAESAPIAKPGPTEVLAALVQAIKQIETTAKGAFGPFNPTREAFIRNWVGDDPESYDCWQRLSNVARCAGAAL